MKYSKLGLVNTKKIFADAITHKYAVPAFNFYNMETLQAIIDAANITHSPVILAVSESALKYMGDDMLIGMIRGANIKPNQKIALHLDHGTSFDICKHAIQLGFSSVMIDASKLPFAENIKLSKQVAKYAHKHRVSVEAELGTLAGIEDENTFGKNSSYTDPVAAYEFVAATGVDSLAISIGTSHGAHKRKHHDEELRWDILKQITKTLPDFPLVLHGASTIPGDLVSTVNKFGGHISQALGIDAKQLRRANKMNICKINVDSDLRLGFTAAVRQNLAENPDNFNPREFLVAARETMTKICIDEIKAIMASKNKSHPRKIK